MKSRLALAALAVAAVGFVGSGAGAVAATSPTTQCAPAANYLAATTSVAFWSTEARCAIVPAGPGGVFGSENFGNKFPGEAAVYMGIVHVAIYDAAVALKGGYKPYAATPAAPADTSPEAAIATAAYDTLTGLQPQLGANQTILDHDYATYLAAIPDGTPKAHGIAVGDQAAAAVLALRANDGRGCTTTVTDLGLPASGPGIWQPGPGAVLGLCLPGMHPLGLHRASQFRPDGPSSLASEQYADDFKQVKKLGRADSTTRTIGQTNQALFWTDHDIRQWDTGMLRLAAARGLDLLQTARMLAMAHVAGGDAMIACFDAKYHYLAWRPFSAINLASDNADPAWKPFLPTPPHPEYPAAHACVTGALAQSLETYFGTEAISFDFDSMASKTSHHYDSTKALVDDVAMARIGGGMHFRFATQAGESLGRDVARWTAAQTFQLR